MAILFSMTYFLGGRAGNGIIINNRSFLLIAVTYALLITLAIISVPLIAGLTMGAFQPGNYVERIVIPPVRIFISLLVIWLWTAYKIKAAKPR